MVKVLTFVMVLIASTLGIRLQMTDDSVLSHLNMSEMAIIFMSPPIIDNSDHTFDPNLNTVDVLNPDDIIRPIEALKTGAIGLATKGLVVAKNGVRVATRFFLKPIAILAGVHLKMFGSGLALGGKILKGTGAGIAKTGTVVKVAGLGSIGLGASAIGWGLDKSTIDTHFQESNQKFIENNL